MIIELENNQDSFEVIAHIELRNSKKRYYGYLEVLKQTFISNNTGAAYQLYVMFKDDEIYGTTCNIETVYYWISQTIGAYYNNDNINI